MKALSIIQPWVYAITHLGKDIENRTWLGPADMIGTRIALHASKTYDRDGEAWIKHQFGVTVPKDKCARGAIVASALLVGYVKESNSRWFMGSVGWQFQDVVAVEPIPCTGHLGLWTVPPELALIAQTRHRASVAAKTLIQASAPNPDQGEVGA